MTAQDSFVDTAHAVLRSYLDADPVAATYLGDHARDDRLPDPSPDAADRRAAELRRQLDRLDTALAESPGDRVDREILRTVLRAELLDLDELREAEWNPMLHNPGSAVRALLTRDFAPYQVRMAALAGRLAAVPAYLAAARARLGEMSAIHLDTALDQLRGTITLLDGAELAAEPTATARRALEQHGSWLAGRRGRASRSPRLGPELFARKLALTLDTALDPAVLLRRAEAELDEVGQRLVEVASGLGGTVPEVLDRLAAERPTNDTILPLCRDALDETTRFVREHELVTVHDDPILVVEMPEIDRGVATAYCRPPGPLETAPPPTEFAVSPTPADWTDAQVTSFYRELNRHMVRNLTVHEAMPGHALQLMHANRHQGSTPVRAVWWSGPFVEGWAVYAEEVMVRAGYRGPELRMQQLKMQLRSILNTILDIRFHCDDLAEPEALQLMRTRGYQEEREAQGKWRRVQLTSTQLCTYFVGYQELRALIGELRRARPGIPDRALHDTVLSAGSPPVRHLRTLLGPAG